LVKILIVKNDDFVKSPSAVRFNSFSAVPEGLAPQGPHSSVFARLASGAFYEVILSPTFYEIIKDKHSQKMVVFLKGRSARLRPGDRVFLNPPYWHFPVTPSCEFLQKVRGYVGRLIVHGKIHRLEFTLAEIGSQDKKLSGRAQATLGGRNDPEWVVGMRRDKRYHSIPWLLKDFFAFSEPNLAAVFRSSIAFF
jgi:hypothetical protein